MPSKVFMKKKAAAILPTVSLLFLTVPVYAQNATGPNSTLTTGPNAAPLQLARYENESSSVHIEPARMGEKAGIAVIFDGTQDLHYYAKAQTAPAPDMELKVEAKSEDFSFGQAVFPPWSTFQDPTGVTVEVYVGKFTVFVPIEPASQIINSSQSIIEVSVQLSGLACTSRICLQPFEKTIRTKLNLRQVDSWKQISLQLLPHTYRDTATGHSVWLALGLAFLAGLLINLMPCVWPVLPLIVMRIVEQAKQGKRRATASGLTFCLGILLFFASLAAANIILQLAYGTALQWGDQFRNPSFVAAMALLLVVLALFMFGLFTITLPSSIASKSDSGKGYAGSVGMGFLAAILSTPCSFGILAAAFAWAQTQKLPLGTITIMVIGLGMALPYAILTSVPGLLNRLPKAGRWMELFKQAVGFILLGIAVWLIAALPQPRRLNVLYFAVVLGFCVWMWGTWVSYGTKTSQKWSVRILAVLLAIAAGWLFLPAPKPELIDFQEYDSDLIQQALDDERPVLIKFTANWCVSCKVIDKLVYTREDVAKLIEKKNVLTIKADTTEKNHPATAALKNKYKEPGVPVSILFLPGRKEPVRWRGKAFAEELKKILQEIPSK